MTQLNSQEHIRTWPLTGASRRRIARHRPMEWNGLLIMIFNQTAQSFKMTSSAR